jgi:molybdate transport system substrate-binding protein
VRLCRRKGIAVVLLAAGVGSCGASDRPALNTVSVAVASNFASAHGALARRFEAETGSRVVASYGATGQLYAQIRNGAPFEIFLAADALRPRLLEEEGFSPPGARFTYSIGRLVLYGPGLDSVRSAGVDLAMPNLTHVAIANPNTAPYGAAAEAAIAGLRFDAPSLRSKLVRGGNVAQALQFVRSGSAELGFVALAQVLDEPARSYWVVPAEYHAPLVQDAVLLHAADANPAALVYWDFLRSSVAAEIIASLGYESPSPRDP